MSFVDSVVFAGSQVETFSSAYGDPGTPLQARDNAVVTVQLVNGSLASIQYVADGSTRVPKERVEAFTDSRTAILDDFRTLELYSARGRRSVSARGQDKGHRAAVGAFVDGVRRGTSPVSLDEVVNVSLATLAIVESLRTGAPVRIETAAPEQTPA